MKDQAVGNSRVEKGIFRSSQSEPSCFHRCKSAICNARSSAGKTCGNEQSFPAPPVFKLEMYREGIRDSKTRRQNPLLHAGVSSKGRDSDFDRKTKRRKIPTDALPSSPSADAQQPQESEDTGTGEDGPPASSDDLFYLDDGTKDGSRVTDKNRKLKIAYTVLAALSRRTTKTLEKELEPAAARRTLDWVLGFFPSLQIRYQHGGENGDVFDPKARSAEDFGIYLHEQIKHFRGTKLYNLNRTRPSFINATFLSGGSIHEEKTADANATVLPEVLVDRLEKSGSRVTGKTMLGTLN